MFASLEVYAQEIVAFVALHRAWAPPIVFALAFGESLAFISLLVPAWAALVGIGVLINSGALSFWPVGIAAALGAAIGDWLSYWIGRKLEYRVQNIWPLSRNPRLIPMGEAFVKKWGVLAIFIGRFFGPLRASVPLVAGIFEMPYWRFQLANFSSAFVWAAVLLTLGDIVTTAVRWLWGGETLTRGICGSARRRRWNSRRSITIAFGRAAAAASNPRCRSGRDRRCCAPPPRPCRRRCNWHRLRRCRRCHWCAPPCRWRWRCRRRRRRAQGVGSIYARRQCRWG